MEIELRPSAAERWTTCTGSPSLIAASGKGTDSATRFTIEGTNAHAVFEAGVNAYREEGRVNERVATACRKAAANIYQDEVPEEMVPAVLEAIRHVSAYCKGFRQLHTLAIETEIFLDLSWGGAEWMKGGTCDLLITHRVADEIVRLGVIDFKYGFREVQADDNPQLQLYAAAALRRASIQNEIPVDLLILQPRLPGGTQSSVTTGSSVIRTWFAEVAQPAAFAASNGKGALLPSEAGCRYCPAKVVCPALRKKLQWAGVVDFATLDAAGKHEIVSLYPVITELVNEVKAEVEEEVLSGSDEYQGLFKAVRKTTRRFFTDEQQEILRGALGPAAFVQKPRTLKELSVLLTSAGYDADEFLSENTARTPPGLTVVLESDRRKALDPASGVPIDR